jgi:hypothetical protein
LDFK